MEREFHYGILLDLLHSSLLDVWTLIYCRNSIRAGDYLVGNLHLATYQEGPDSRREAERI